MSSLITLWFIKEGKFLYFSGEKMFLSCVIAGAKWGIQIVAALLLLAEKKWIFIKRIGFTCFVGSCILIPFSLFAQIRLIEKNFLISLILAVLVMIVLYYRAVQHTGISIKWFWGWMFCLVIAVSLQLFVVFQIS